MKDWPRILRDWGKFELGMPAPKEPLDYDAIAAEIESLRSKLSASEAEKADLEARANSHARRLNEAVAEKDNWQDDCRKMHGNRDYWKERAEKAEAEVIALKNAANQAWGKIGQMYLPGVDPTRYAAIGDCLEEIQAAFKPMLESRAALKERDNG